MPTLTQYEFVKRHLEKVKEPILIIGSKEYDYDAYSIRQLLIENNYQDIVGLDIEQGKNVDVVADLDDNHHHFFELNSFHFKTVICMSVLMYVKNPFLVAENISKVSSSDAALFLCEPFTHRTTAMPVDRWRFTFDSLMNIFYMFNFDLNSFQYSYARSNVVFKDLHDPQAELRYHIRHPDENFVLFCFRRILSALFAKGIFKLPRLLPEISLFAIATRNKSI